MLAAVISAWEGYGEILPHSFLVTSFTNFQQRIYIDCIKK